MGFTEDAVVRMLVARRNLLKRGVALRSHSVEERGVTEVAIFWGHHVFAICVIHA